MPTTRRKSTVSIPSPGRGTTSPTSLTASSSQMRKALVVGVDHYSHISQLFGCVNDAHAVKTVLERHSDGTVNFDVRLFAGTGATELVQRGALKDGITDRKSTRLNSSHAN